MKHKTNLLMIIGPGILIAATGVGAGDLGTGALTGNLLGTAVLWAVLLGAFFKFVITEGLTRWQLATGETLLEGSTAHLGKFFEWPFLVYLLVWTYFVAAVLMSAVGVVCHAILPLFGSTASAAAQDKVFYGILHSVAAVVLVRFGGFKFFEKVMSVLVGMMFFIVLATAIALQPSPTKIVEGMLIPSIPEIEDASIWIVALIGGVGGSLTVMCYGYWIREKNRTSQHDLRDCRIDLSVGYVVTAIFGLAMVVIGSQVAGVDKTGANLIVQIATKLEASFPTGGTVVKWGFLFGAWGAVFSSLLGVWQCIPYLFADFWRLQRIKRLKADSKERVPGVVTSSHTYRIYLYGLATLPIAGLFLTQFKSAQLIYSVIGALCVPGLSLVLLLLNGSKKRIGEQFKNSYLTNIVLFAMLIFFSYFGWLQVEKKLKSMKVPPKAKAEVSQRQ